MSVLAPTLSSLWKQVEDCGLDPEPLFSKHGVNAAKLADANARISYLKTDRIMADAAQLSGDLFFGLNEAKYLLPSQMGPLGFAWLASTSLRSAIQRLQRYINVLHERMQLTVTDNMDSVQVFIHTDVPSANAYQRDVGYLAALNKMCRFVRGNDWNPALVSVAHPAPADTSRFYEMFRCPVEFNAGQNSLNIDKQQADERLIGANKQLAQLNDHIVVRYLASQSRDDIVNRVKSAILERLGQGSVTETAIAESLHMSTRKLHRKLDSKNTNFKKLLLEIRSELANQYINDITLTLTEISFMLGFSEISSFSRAYKRWTGMSPSEARKSQNAAYQSSNHNE